MGGVYFCADDVTNYDPTSDRIDILDLRGYMSVGNTLHGEGVYNGETIIGLTGNTQYGYDGKDEFEAIMNYERNYFQGDVPTLQKIEDIFGVDDLRELRTVENCDEFGCREVLTGTGAAASDGSGWELYYGLGGQAHCDYGTGGACFKFQNTQTGQEVVYSDCTDDGVFNPTIDLTTETGGTFNYATDSVFGDHGAWDYDPFKSELAGAPPGADKFAEPEKRPALDLE